MVDMHRDLKLIKMIIIHCSDTDLAEFDNIESIRKWHMAKGWRDVGYNYFIDKKGAIFEGRPLDQAGAHCAGYNMCSIGICFSGRKIFYDAQFSMGWFLIKDLMKRFGLTKKDIYPHNHFNSGKTCPNFAINKIWQFDDETVS